MFKLIIKLILVLLPVIAILIAFELIARKIPTTYSTKLSSFNAKKSKIEILVMGSSHSNFGINPEYFGRVAFNLSNTSQCLNQDYKLLLKYLPECENVKMVIIPISYFTLQSDLAQSPEAWRVSYYSYYMGVQTDNICSIYDLKNYSALFLWDGPLQVIKAVRNIKNMNINEYGYQVPEKHKQSIDDVINEREGKKRVNYHDKVMKMSLIGFNISILELMVKELKRRNIEAVFVTTPVYKTYKQFISAKSYKIMTDVINNLSAKYSVQYFNYFDDKRFDFNDFLDNDHLNEEGAKKLSLILNNEVISMR